MSAQLDRINRRLESYAPPAPRMNGRPVTADFEAEKLARERLILIPEGEYIGRIRDWKTYTFRAQRPKVSLKIEIISDIDGDTAHAGEEFFRQWNVARVDTKTGEFVASGWKSDLVREFVAVTNRRITRLDRVPMTALRGEVVCAVRTVCKDSAGIPLHEFAQYSVVGRLLRPAP